MRDLLRPLTQTKTVLGDGELTMDAYGRAKVVSDYSVLHSLFTFDIPYQLWIMEENGTELLDISTSTRSGSVGGELVFKSGPVLNDESHLHTKRHPRYQPNRGHVWSASIFLPDKNLEGERNFGMFNHESGVFFRLKADGKLYAVLKNGGVETMEEEIKHLPEGFDVEKGNLYDIQMQWRGVGDIYFFTSDSATGRSKLVHSFDLVGTRDSIVMPDPALSAAFVAINKGDEVTIKSGCIDVSSEGGNKTREQFSVSTGNEVTVTAGGDPIYALRIPLLHHGQTNTRDLRRARLIVTSSKKGEFEVYSTRDTTAFVINTGSWTPHNGGNIEVFLPVLAADSELDTAKAGLFCGRFLQANVTEYVTNPDSDHIDCFLTAGDYFVVIGKGATADMRCSFEWGEEI